MEVLKEVLCGRHFRANLRLSGLRNLFDLWGGMLNDRSTFDKLNKVSLGKYARDYCLESNFSETVSGITAAWIEKKRSKFIMCKTTGKKLKCREGRPVKLIKVCTKYPDRLRMVLLIQKAGKKLLYHGTGKHKY